VLGVPVRSETPVPALIAFLKHKQMLIVLDSCEHVIDAVAQLAEEILKVALNASILATSREPLRVTDERVRRLSSLALPPASTTMTAAGAVAYPAVQLFVERAIASFDDFELNDANAGTVPTSAAGWMELRSPLSLPPPRSMPSGSTSC
jgi:predicted ATPase